ncbi:MAG: class I SAM-dependent methyltransferase [Lachnospiraceae bacterium]|jgi:SAM-dependent methyltransferase|nr:class I SAM-dependent methyltransferase [Lachnospiraceae bacterium]
MRDLVKYEKDYNVPNFEDYQIEYRKKKILSILKTYKPQRILEIGCGMKPIFPYIDWDYEVCVIVEPCTEFYEHAKSLVGNKKVFCYKECFEASERLRDYSFDFIICSSLLHEINDPSCMIGDIADISNKDTLVHINVPNALSLHRILAKEMGIINDVHEMSDRNRLYQQNTVFDLNTLKELVDSAGFDVLDEGSFFIKPFSHEQMYRMLQHRIIDEKVLDGLYLLEKYFPSYGSEIFLNLKLRIKPEV